MFTGLDKKRSRPGKENLADGIDAGKVKVVLDTVKRNQRAQIR